MSVLVFYLAGHRQGLLFTTVYARLAPRLMSCLLFLSPILPEEHILLFLCEEKECESQNLWLDVGPLCSPEDFAPLNSPIHTCDNGRGRTQCQVSGRWHLCTVSALLFSPPFLPGGESPVSMSGHGYQGKLLEDVSPLLGHSECGSRFHLMTVPCGFSKPAVPASVLLLW